MAVHEADEEDVEMMQQKLERELQQVHAAMDKKARRHAQRARSKPESESDLDECDKLECVGQADDEDGSAVEQLQQELQQVHAALDQKAHSVR